MNIIDFCKLSDKSKKKIKKKYYNPKKIIYYIFDLANYDYIYKRDIKISKYEKAIKKLVSCDDKQSIITFLKRIEWSAPFFGEKNISRKIIFCLYNELDKYYDGKIDIEIIMHLFRFLSKSDQYELRDIIGKSKIEDMIITSNNAYFAYLYPQMFDDCEVAKFEKVVINSGDINVICDFANDVKGANVLNIANSLIKKHDTDSIYRFITSVKRIDVTKIRRALIELNDSKIICELAKGQKNNVLELEDKMLEIGEAKDIYNFACKVKDANIPKLEEAIIRTRNVKYINKFFEKIQSSRISKLFFDIKNLKTLGFSFNESCIFDFLDKCINENLFSKYSNDELYIKFLLDKRIINKEDFTNYLNTLNEIDKDNFILMLLNLKKKIRKQILEKDVKKEELRIKDLSEKKPKKLITDDERLVLINLSLSKANVLPSRVKDFKDVAENLELYLDILKRCDPIKHYYYEDAFMGKISFERADKYYKYYLHEKLDDNYLCDNVNNVLKLKYSKNKKQKN